jgi:hypothetical protein
MDEADGRRAGARRLRRAKLHRPAEFDESAWKHQAASIFWHFSLGPTVVAAVYTTALTVTSPQKQAAL